MVAKIAKANKVPVMLLDQTSAPAFRIFDQNDWKGMSKAVIGSCAPQLGLLNYSVDQLQNLFAKTAELCAPRFDELKFQWEKAKWPVHEMDYFVEVPAVHLFIQVFLNSTKTFLDLLVQLLTTEGIINKKIHGFHKRGEEHGGETLHLLKNRQFKKGTADAIHELIAVHKASWIDIVIAARDALIHPEKGAIQVMFQLDITGDESELKLLRVRKPMLNNKEFDQFAGHAQSQLVEFSKAFLEMLRGS